MAEDPWAAYVQPAAPAADPWAQYVTSEPAAAPTGRDIAAPSGDPLGDAENMAPPGVKAEPWSATGQRVDDLGRLAANGATLGYADKVAGAVLGTGTAVERARSQDSAARAGPIGTLASVAGSLAPVGVAARGVGAVADAAGIGSQLARGAATGATIGAGGAAGNDQDIATGAATGAAVGAGSAAAGAAGSRLAGLFADPAPVMSSPQLQAAARQAYSDADQAGVVYSPQATDRLRQAVQDHMANFGYDPALQPGGVAVLNALDRNAGNNATLQGVDLVRQNAGRMGSPSFPSAGALGSGIKGLVDDFTANPQPGDVLTGNGPGGVGALNNARQLYQRSSKDQDLSDALDAAGLRVGSTGSGGNINNATRQQVRQLYQGRQDWTPDEDAALRQIIMGTPVSNALRQVGKLSPEGNGLMMHLSLPAAGYGLAGSGGAAAGAAPLAGFAAKRAADAMTARAVDNAGRLIRVGGDATSLMPTPNIGQLYAQQAGAATGPLTLGAMYGAPAEQR